jgi:NAD(P)-dependent dehydrogenase (short-subunit alcohol dehydrogenase family)
MVKSPGLELIFCTALDSDGTTSLLFGVGSGARTASKSAPSPSIATHCIDELFVCPTRVTVGSRSGGVKSQADSHATAFQAASSQFSAIDVVVNNAGIGLGGPLEAVSPDQLREHLEVNVVGVAAVCQAAAAHMRSHGEG